MKSEKDMAAVALGKRRAARITVEERRSWAKQRWASVSKEDRAKAMEIVRAARLQSARS